MCYTLKDDTGSAANCCWVLVGKGVRLHRDRSTLHHFSILFVAIRAGMGADFAKAKHLCPQMLAFLARNVSIQA